METNQVKVWSTYQNNIFDFVKSGNGSAVIEAVAGSGKTTTIVEAIKLVTGSTIFLAFNRSIADELGRRGVNARTFHSLTYSIVLRHKGARAVNKNKLFEIVQENLGDEDVRNYGSFITKLVDLAKQAGVGCLVPNEPNVWMDIVDHHDLELASEDATLNRAVALAMRLLEASNTSREVDFSDMLYIPVLEGLSLPKYDFVFVDEAQDTNAIQRALLRKIMRPESRLVAVGDPAQAIYGFRGADSNSINLIAEEFNCIKLPLTVSYRCPKSVVEHARKWVKHIEPAPTAPEGKVTDLGLNFKNADFVKGDLVVCRTTAPVVKLAYSLLRDRISARIMGKEIGEGLKSLVTKMKAKGIEALIEKLNAYTTRETEKLTARGKDEKASAIQDKTDTILVLINSLTETRRTIPALIETIDSLFDDKNATVTLATIHKAKGLEASRVFWLNSQDCPSKWARKDWQIQQEYNLCYVATTRAMQELVLIAQPK